MPAVDYAGALIASYPSLRHLYPCSNANTALSDVVGGRHLTPAGAVTFGVNGPQHSENPFMDPADDDSRAFRIDAITAYADHLFNPGQIGCIEFWLYSTVPISQATTGSVAITLALVDESSGNITYVGFGSVSAGVSNETFSLVHLFNSVLYTTSVQSITIPAGRWVHFAINWNAGAGVYDFYVDGTKRVVTSGTLPHVPLIVSGNRVSIGRQSSTSVVARYAYVALYENPLSEQAIKRNVALMYASEDATLRGIVFESTLDPDLRGVAFLSTRDPDLHGVVFSAEFPPSIRGTAFSFETDGIVESSGTWSFLGDATVTFDSSKEFAVATLGQWGFSGITQPRQPAFVTPSPWFIGIYDARPMPGLIADVAALRAVGLRIEHVHFRAGSTQVFVSGSASTMHRARQRIVYSQIPGVFTGAIPPGTAITLDLLLRWAPFNRVIQP